jgi:beta-glucosidase
MSFRLTTGVEGVLNMKKLFGVICIGVAAALVWVGNGSLDGRSAEAARSDAVWPAITPAIAKNADIENRIQDILGRMTLEEKVGQIMQVEIQHISPEELKTYHIGSVLNGGGSLPNRNKYATPSEWVALADAYYEASMDTSDGGVAIPIIWGSDAVHGHNNVIGATLFPHNIGLGAANNPDLLRDIGRVTATEMRVTGIDWTFAPTVAVAQNDRWGRAYESYSEDPAIVRAYAGKVVEGLQGAVGSEEFLDDDHVVATAKHFVGDGGTVHGDDQGDAIMPEAELRDIHAAGYFSALEAGVQTAMASFSSWNGEKMHGNKYLLTDVLKGQLGFDGLIVGDWNGHGQVPGCTNATCPKAINAGLDLFMTIEEWRDLYANTLAQVKSGEIPLARLDDAVSRILRVKLRAGLFEKAKPSLRGIAGKDGIIGSDPHRAVARQAVRESLVLLKNNGGLLPLDPKKTILVTGDGADNIGKQSGGWTISWQGTGNTNSDFPGASSIYKGIKDAVDAAGGKAVLSVDGTYTDKPDVAVVVFGENPYAEGQGDIDTLEFEPGAKTSLKLLKKLKSEGVPVVSIFLSGRPLWTNPEINASDAFVAAWLPGSEGGGVADVLIADVNGKARNDFKGTLSFSWPATPLQEKLNPHHPGYEPLFPLGYGLTYEKNAKDLANLPEDVEGVLSGEATTLQLYAGRAMAPFRVFVANDATTQVISGYYAQVPDGTVSGELVDKDIQGDAVKIKWSNAAQGRFFMGDGNTIDLTAYAKAGARLNMDVRLDSLQAGAASLSMECVEEACAEAKDILPALNQLDAGVWGQLSVPLACFGENPDAYTAVTAPFVISVSGQASISFANVELVADPEARVCAP